MPCARWWRTTDSSSSSGAGPGTRSSAESSLPIVASCNLSALGLALQDAAFKVGGMRVHVATDHAGYEAKNHLAEALRADGHEVVDHGPFFYDAADDYPVFCLRAAEAVAAEPESLGVVLGGSGNGEQMAANKVRGVRAALAWSEDTAKLAREHNDARVISIGARLHSFDDVVRFVKVFLATPYSGEPRHTGRIQMLSRYEESGELPALPRPAGSEPAGSGQAAQA